jgi:hypothetical protein
MINFSHKRLFGINLPKNSLFLYLIFIACVFLYRVLIPFNDEPDYETRTLEALNQPFSLFKIFYNQPPVNEECLFSRNFSNIFYSYNFNECSLTFLDLVKRTLIVFFETSFFILIPFLPKLKKIFNLHFLDHITRERMQAFFVSLLVPSVIYHISLFSVEAQLLAISLLIFVFIDCPVITFLLVSLGFLIDVGNSIVILFCTTLIYIIPFFYLRLSKLRVTILLLIMLYFFYTFFNSLLYLFSDLSPTYTFEIMYKNSKLNHSLIEYILLIYPSLVFLTSSLITSIPALIFPLAFMKRYLLVIEQGFFWDNIDFYRSVAALYAIILIVTCLPLYSNGKYYTFLMPFFVMPLIKAFHFENFSSFIITLNTIIILSLITLLWH